MKELILHIGSTKTGSSAIQHFLWTNQVALEAHGVLYPNVGIAGSAHHLLAASIHPSAWHMHAAAFAGKDRVACFHEFAKQVQEEATRSSANRIFLSSEYLWGRYDKTFFSRIQTLRESFEMRLLCYIRPQDEWLESTYVQAVKSGEGRTFREWLLAHLDQAGAFCHYDVILRQWEQFIPPERIHVRLYESAEGAMDSIADVVDFLDIQKPQSFVSLADKSNPSPVPQDTEIIRFINRSAISQVKKQKLRKILLRNSQKKELHTRFHYLSADETIELMKRYQAGNAAIAQKYAKSRTGPLFSRPLPAPGEWPSWREPTIDECMPSIVKLISELIPE
jgi:capsular polysaccharide export protein